MPTRCNRWYLLQILLHAQHVSCNIMPIIRSSRVLYRWSLPVVFGALVFRLSVWCGAEGYVSGFQAAALLKLLMMGIVLPETCWACNKICNKYHLLHLVSILFPHIHWNYAAYRIISFCFMNYAVNTVPWNNISIPLHQLRQNSVRNQNCLPQLLNRNISQSSTCS